MLLHRKKCAKYYDARIGYLEVHLGDSLSRDVSSV
jgi:hypothetical protein